MEAANTEWYHDGGTAVVTRDLGNVAEVSMPQVAGNVLDLVGNTPMVRLRHMDAGLCELYVKLESQNPSGSIKDRPALAMITAAEQDGRLRPGAMLVEATAGNTGLGLALVAAQRGYGLTLVIPDKMSREKIFHLKAMGAHIVMTRSDVGKGHPAYYQDLAEQLASQTPGAFYVNQFGNPANPAAHQASTGPEIWEQMAGRMDAMVCGVGSGGTITGLSRYLADVAPHVEMVLADPEGSVLAQYVRNGIMGEAGSWLVEGIGEDFVPPICDLSRVKHAFSISDAQSFLIARELLLKEGLLAGSSAGTLVAAALLYCQQQTAPRRVVTLIPDSGSRYLSKMFNEYWMMDQGFSPREVKGDLRDVISRRHGRGEVVTLDATDTLQRAYQLMKMNDVSQLPVTQGNAIVGIMDESDLLLAVEDDTNAFQHPVGEVMSRNLETVPPSASIRALLPIMDAGRVAIVVDGERFLGLITRMDVIQHLRRQRP